MLRRRLLLVIFLSFYYLLPAQNIDTASSIVNFKINNLVFGNVKGSFKEMQGTVNIDLKNLNASKINVCIAAKTVNTGNEKRDKHLRSKDFFYVENNPEICFTSNQISRKGKFYIAIGKLTMLGVTREVTIPFKFEKNTFTGTFKINRTDYHLAENENPFAIGEMVKIKIICVLN